MQFQIKEQLKENKGLTFDPKYNVSLYLANEKMTVISTKVAIKVAKLGLKCIRKGSN